MATSGVEGNSNGPGSDRQHLARAHLGRRDCNSRPDVTGDRLARIYGKMMKVAAMRLPPCLPREIEGGTRNTNTNTKHAITSIKIRKDLRRTASFTNIIRTFVLSKFEIAQHGSHRFSSHCLARAKDSEPLKMRSKPSQVVPMIGPNFSVILLHCIHFFFLSLSYCYPDVPVLKLYI